MTPQASPSAPGHLPLLCHNHDEELDILVYRGNPLRKIHVFSHLPTNQEPYTRKQLQEVTVILEMGGCNMRGQLIYYTGSGALRVMKTSTTKKKKNSCSQK